MTSRKSGAQFLLANAWPRGIEFGDDPVHKSLCQGAYGIAFKNRSGMADEFHKMNTILHVPNSNRTDK